MRSRRITLGVLGGILVGLLVWLRWGIEWEEREVDRGYGEEALRSRGAGFRMAGNSHFGRRRQCEFGRNKKAVDQQ